MKILILGAGPGGLCAGWNLAKDGHKVVVIEKESLWGGQSITFTKDKFLYDLGPHNIHSIHRCVIDFLKENLKDEFVEHKILPQIFFRNQRINYPLIGTQVLKSLPVSTALLCGMSFVLNRLKLFFFFSSFKDDGTYERWVINRFGRRFYDIFFGPYSQKAWGVPPSEISDIVAKKRIAVKSLVELIHSVLFKRESFHPENPRVIRMFYPRKGAGVISDFFAKGILRDGGEIRLNTEVKSLKLENNKIVSVEIFDNVREKKETLILDDDWDILSTIPVNELLLRMNGVDGKVKRAAEALDFSSEVFLYMNVNKENVFGTHLLYFSEDEFPFNRIYDVGLFSRDMVPPGKNAICIELTCTFGDKIWKMTDEELFELCMGVLEKHKLLARESVDSYHTARTKHAYPRFRVGYQERLQTIFDFFDNLENIQTFGRQGLFAYANIDEVIWMAFEMAKNLPYQRRMHLYADELLPEYINFSS